MFDKVGIQTIPMKCRHGEVEFLSESDLGFLDCDHRRKFLFFFGSCYFILRFWFVDWHKFVNVRWHENAREGGLIKIMSRYISLVENNCDYISQLHRFRVNIYQHERWHKKKNKKNYVSQFRSLKRSSTTRNQDQPNPQPFSLRLISTVYFTEMEFRSRRLLYVKAFVQLWVESFGKFFENWQVDWLSCARNAREENF